MLTAETVILADGSRALKVGVFDPLGNQLSGFDPSRPATATLTQVAQNVASVTILAANAARRYFKVVNTGSKTLFLAFGATATATAFSIILAAQAQTNEPVNGYTGVISGIWSGAGSGFAVITEITT